VHLYDIPLLFVLVGLALYTVLGGSDFGAGFWQLGAGSGRTADRIREHAHHAMAPVWEANHVWLIFVLTVSWTAYPRAFASIASTLSVALFIAGIGIILRGATYSLRPGARAAGELRAIDTVFALSSILTPFALGAAVGGIASRRVPVGNAAGDLISSWLNPTSIMVGTLAVATSAYLAAVYMAADAARLGEPDLERWFRGRALVTGAVAGALAVAGIAVVHSDARPLYDGLVDGNGLAALIASGVAGTATLALVWRRLYELARFSAAAAVAAIVAGWALAQSPVLLPGLTVQQAAAPHDTLVAVIIAVLAAIPVLLPSLALLFTLVLKGRFDREQPADAIEGGVSPGELLGASRQGLRVRAAIGCLIAGFGFLNVAEAGWAHAIGVASLLAFIVLGFLAVVPSALTTTGDG
jgi:cytochrome d ubiquinol oxidase subunit II